MSLGQPWKGYGQEGIDGGMSRDFVPVRATSHHGTAIGVGGAYGLLGIGIATEKPAARAWTAVRSITARIELAAWDQPRGGASMCSSMAFARAASRHGRIPAGLGSWRLTSPTDLTTSKCAPWATGTWRIFGMSLDRSEMGIVVDALGINGAQVGTLLHWGEEHFAEQLRHRAPALVVLAYGTNESMDATLDDEEFERRLVDVLGRVARAVPAASCLLLGPPDRGQRVAAEDGARAKGDGNWESAPRILRSPTSSDVWRMRRDARILTRSPRWAGRARSSVGRRRSNRGLRRTACT